MRNELLLADVCFCVAAEGAALSGAPVTSEPPPLEVEAALLGEFFFLTKLLDLNSKLQKWGIRVRLPTTLPGINLKIGTPSAVS